MNIIHKFFSLYVSPINFVIKQSYFLYDNILSRYALFYPIVISSTFIYNIILGGFSFVLLADYSSETAITYFGSPFDDLYIIFFLFFCFVLPFILSFILIKRYKNSNLYGQEEKPVVEVKNKCYEKRNSSFEQDKEILKQTDGMIMNFSFWKGGRVGQLTLANKRMYLKTKKGIVWEAYLESISAPSLETNLGTERFSIIVTENDKKSKVFFGHRNVTKGLAILGIGAFGLLIKDNVCKDWVETIRDVLKNTNKNKSSLDMLKERFAKGKIDEEEFLKKKKLLED